MAAGLYSRYLLYAEEQENVFTKAIIGLTMCQKYDIVE
jgi:hypothetical protein